MHRLLQRCRQSLQICRNISPEQQSEIIETVKAECTQVWQDRQAVVDTLCEAVGTEDRDLVESVLVEDGKDLEAKSRGALHEKLTADYLKELPEGLSSETFYRVGNAAQQIIEFANEHEISLIVLGRPKPRLLRSLLFGSTASKVARYAPCPLLIVPDTGII